MSLLLRRGVCVALAAWFGVAPALAGQAWDAPDARALVARAAAFRADSAGPGVLTAYRARARGVVLYLQQFGRALTEPPRPAKVDQLLVEVYWRAPGRSKQVIRAWRDSTMRLLDLRYHRDHLGIVTNDFGNAIRLGEGDEVRDVLHPLAPDAPDRYSYRLGDSVRLRSTDGTLLVRAVDVRPRNLADAAVVGTLYLDVATAALVRFRFTFTPAAYRDHTLEDIAVELENARVDGLWLPWRQSIEIRRQQPMLDFSARGIIRAAWTIEDHEIDGAVPEDVFTGPAIGGLHAPGGPASAWSAPIDVAHSGAELPDGEALAAARQAAARLVSESILSGLPALRFSFGGASDLLRVNRVQGVAIGAGAALGIWGGRATLRPSLQLATADGRVTGGLGVEYRLASGRGHVTLTAERRIRDVADDAPISPLVNSIVAQETGDDHGDWYLADRVAVGLDHRIGARSSISLEAGRERALSLVTKATPARGTYRPNPALGSDTYTYVRGALGVMGRGIVPPVDLRLHAEAGIAGAGYARVSGRLSGRTRARRSVIEWRMEAGQGTGDMPAARSFVLGGWGTLPGEPFRAFGGRGYALARADWMVLDVGPSVRLGPVGPTAIVERLGPFVAAGAAWGPISGLPWRPSWGLRPVLGVSMDILSSVLHAEVGWAPRAGAGLVIDAGSAWWGIL